MVGLMTNNIATYGVNESIRFVSGKPGTIGEVDFYTNGKQRVIILTGNETLTPGGGLFARKVLQDLSIYNGKILETVKNRTQQAFNGLYKEGEVFTSESRVNASNLKYVVVCPPNYSCNTMSRDLRKADSSKSAFNDLTKVENVLFVTALKDKAFNAEEETHRLALAKFLLKKSYKNAILKAMEQEQEGEVWVPEISGYNFGMGDLEGNTLSKKVFFEAIDELMDEYKNKNKNKNDKFDVSRIVVFNKDDNFQEWTKAKKEYDIKKKSVALSNRDKNLVRTGVSHLFDSRELHGDAVGWVHDSNSESNKYTKIFDVNSFVSSEEDSEDEEGLEEVVKVIVTAEVDEVNGDIKLHSENMEATVLAALELMSKDPNLVPDMASLGVDDRKKYKDAFNSLKAMGVLGSYNNDNDASKESALSRFQEAFGISAKSQRGFSDGDSRQFVPTISHSGPTVLDEIKKCIKKGMQSDNLNSVYAMQLATSLENNKPEDDVRLLNDFLCENPEYAPRLESSCNLKKGFFREYFGISSVSPEYQLPDNGASERVIDEHLNKKNSWITEVELQVLSVLNRVGINIYKTDGSVKKINDQQQGGYSIELNYNGAHYELNKDGRAVPNAADGRCGYLAVAQALLIKEGHGSLDRDKVSQKADELRKNCTNFIKNDKELKQQLGLELLVDKGSEVSFDVDKAVKACAALSAKNRNEKQYDAHSL